MEPEGRNAEGGNGLFGRLVYYTAFLLIFVGVAKLYLVWLENYRLLHPEIIEAVAALGAERIVLVACDPAALARDTGTVLRAGYRLGSLSALDMFPHTHHFETIAVLDRS